MDSFSTLIKDLDQNQRCGVMLSDFKITALQCLISDTFESMGIVLKRKYYWGFLNNNDGTGDYPHLSTAQDDGKIDHRGFAYLKCNSIYRIDYMNNTCEEVGSIGESDRNKQIYYFEIDENGDVSYDGYEQFRKLEN